MKKIIFTTFITLFVAILNAQTAYDALRLGQTELLGSARYLSMGGAFGALGGEVSALKDNPAGLGVFRNGEISITLNTFQQQANTLWYEDNEKSKGGMKVKVNDFTYLISLPLWKTKQKGLLQSNFSFGFNKLKNFNKSLIAKGMTNTSFTDFLADFTNANHLVEEDFDKNAYENENIPWLSILGYDAYLIDYDENQNQWVSIYDPNEKAVSLSEVYETGGINQFSLGWGGNFNNNLFIGVNFNFWDIDYRVEAFITESFSKGVFSLKNKLIQTGTGMNMKVGAIYLPTEHLRLGVSLHTPTFINIDQRTSPWLQYHINNNEDILSPNNSYNRFSLITGLQGQASMAYLLGNKGLISAEYNFINYPNMELAEEDGDVKPFQDENNDMSNIMNYGHIIKIGAEARVSKNISIRGGYVYQSPATNSDYKDGKKLRLNTVSTNTEYFQQKSRNYYSIGIGYRTAMGYFDMGYMIKLHNDDFYPYQLNRNEPQPAEVESFVGNLIFTLGLKM